VGSEMIDTLDKDEQKLLCKINNPNTEQYFMPERNLEIILFYTNTVSHTK
jgi:hypothetical protein